MIDVTHTVTTGGRGCRCPRPSLTLQVLLDLVFALQLGGVPEFLDHQHGGLLVQGLVDRRHDADVHQHLDDFGRLDGHLGGQFRHRDGLTDRDFALCGVVGISKA